MLLMFVVWTDVNFKQSIFILACDPFAIAVEKGGDEI